MKRYSIVCFILLALSAQCFAFSEASDIFDSFRPLSYNAKPVEKITLAYSTEKNIGSDTSTLFGDHLLYFYMPYAYGDVRVEALLPKSSTSAYVQIGSLVPIGFASIYGGYFTRTTTRSNDMLIMDLIFDDPNFSWGAGFIYTIGSGAHRLIPAVKASKNLDIAPVNIDGKIMCGFFPGGTEYELNVKVKPISYPMVYAGTILRSMDSDPALTYIQIGAVYTF